VCKFSQKGCVVDVTLQGVREEVHIQGLKLLRMVRLPQVSNKVYHNLFLDLELMLQNRSVQVDRDEA
jgi:hypothetical protein